MNLYYIHHRAGRGLPAFIHGDTAADALRIFLEECRRSDDGLYDVWPTVIPRSNNNECGSP